MRKTLTALAVVGAALAAPMLTTGTAYAADVPVTTPIATIVANTISSVAIPGGCTLTYVGKVLGQPVGPVLGTGPGTITIGYGATVTYVLAQDTNTMWYVGCI